MAIKHFLSITFFSCISLFASAQITFKVSDVKPATDTLDEVPFRQALEARIGAKIESFDYSQNKVKIVPTYAHSFVAALHHCYADHRPMVISPDMIWLMICQGLAQHINQHSDSLRTQIVDHQGKKTIRLRNDYLVKGKVDNNWAGEFPKFADSLKKYVNKELYNFVLQDFSTTTKTEKIAYQITLMDAVGSYFEYGMDTECGIPEITLEGSKKDWKRVYKNAKKLDDFGMQFWTKELLPILDEFVKASKGKVDKHFWQSIYMYDSSCGAEGINGWILTFFPYYYGAGYLYENSFRNTRIQDESLPTGISLANLDWFYVQELFKMEVYAGFLGIQQDKTTKALRPLIQWSLRDASSTKIEKEAPVFRRKRSALMGGDEEDWIIDINLEIEQEEEEEEYEMEGKVYTLAQEMPKFPDGDLGLRNFIAKNLTYPKEAIENKIEGKVYVRFCVTKRGKVSRIAIARSINPIIDKEALRVVSTLPKWQPGSIHGKNVNVWYTVPVNFKLANLK